jgi:hypothetical protein
MEEAITAAVEEAVDEKVSPIAEQFEEMRSEQTDRDAEIVANAMDLDKDEVKEQFTPDRLNYLAENVDVETEDQQQRANYAGVGGGFNREVDDSADEDLSHISAGTMSDFEDSGGDN